MLGIRAQSVVIQCVWIILLNARRDRGSSMLLHEGTDKVPADRIGTLKAKSLVSHKSTSELWTHIDAGRHIALLLSKPMNRVTGELVTFGELKVKSEGITTNPQRPHSQLQCSGMGQKT